MFKTIFNHACSETATTVENTRQQSHNSVSVKSIVLKRNRIRQRRIRLHIISVEIKTPAAETQHNKRYFLL